MDATDHEQLSRFWSAWGLAYLKLNRDDKKAFRASCQEARSISFQLTDSLTIPPDDQPGMLLLRLSQFRALRRLHIGSAQHPVSSAWLRCALLRDKLAGSKRLAPWAPAAASSSTKLLAAGAGPATPTRQTAPCGGNACARAAGASAPGGLTLAGACTTTCPTSSSPYHECNISNGPKPSSAGTNAAASLPELHMLAGEGAAALGHIEHLGLHLAWDNVEGRRQAAGKGLLAAVVAAMPKLQSISLTLPPELLRDRRFFKGMLSVLQGIPALKALHLAAVAGEGPTEQLAESYGEAQAALLLALPGLHALQRLHLGDGLWSWEGLSAIVVAPPPALTSLVIASRERAVPRSVRVAALAVNTEPVGALAVITELHLPEMGLDVELLQRLDAQLPRLRKLTVARVSDGIAHKCEGSSAGGADTGEVVSLQELQSLTVCDRAKQNSARDIAWLLGQLPKLESVHLAAPVLLDTGETDAAAFPRQAPPVDLAGAADVATLESKLQAVAATAAAAAAAAATAGERNEAARSGGMPGYPAGAAAGSAAGGISVPLKIRYRTAHGLDTVLRKGLLQPLRLLGQRVELSCWAPFFIGALSPDDLKDNNLARCFPYAVQFGFTGAAFAPGGASAALSGLSRLRGVAFDACDGLSGSELEGVKAALQHSGAVAIVALHNCGVQGRSAR